MLLLNIPDDPGLPDPELLKKPGDPGPLDGKLLDPALLKNPGEPGIVDTVFPDPALLKKPGEPGLKGGELPDPALLKKPGEPGLKDGEFLDPALLKKPGDPGRPRIVDPPFPNTLGKLELEVGIIPDPALLKNPGEPGVITLVPEPVDGIRLGRVLLNGPVDPDLVIGTNLKPLFEKVIGIGFPTIGILLLNPGKLFWLFCMLGSCNPLGLVIVGVNPCVFPRAGLKLSAPGKPKLLLVCDNAVGKFVRAVLLLKTSSSSPPTLNVLGVGFPKLPRTPLAELIEHMRHIVPSTHRSILIYFCNLEKTN